MTVRCSHVLPTRWWPAGHAPPAHSPTRSALATGVGSLTSLEPELGHRAVGCPCPGTVGLCVGLLHGSPK